MIWQRDSGLHLLFLSERPIFSSLNFDFLDLLSKHGLKGIWGSIKAKKDNLQNQILDLNVKEESSPLDASKKELLHILELDLIQLLTQEEVAWKQCSRDQWLREGDQNTCYFHRITNGRRRSNKIFNIQTDKSLVFDEQKIVRVFTTHFKQILGTPYSSHIIN